MSEDKAPKSPGRREFFKTASLGAGAVVAGTAIAGSAAATSEAKAAGSVAQSQGYRETEHVKRVYELARF